MKKHSKSSRRSEATLKRTKARGPVPRDAKEVLAEVLEKLTGKLDAPAVSTSVKEKRRANTVGPNRDRLTVGVDLGDRALVKKVVFDEVQRFPTNSTMQNPACVKLEEFRSEDGFHGGCGIARECG